MSLRDTLRKKAFDGNGRFKHAKVYFGDQVQKIGDDGKPEFQDAVDDEGKPVKDKSGETKQEPVMVECGFGPFVEVREPSVGSLSKVRGNAGNQFEFMIAMATELTFVPKITDPETGQDTEDFESGRFAPLTSQERLWEPSDVRMMRDTPFGEIDFMKRCASAAANLLDDGAEVKKR